jgi:hypothetical protein
MMECKDLLANLSNYVNGEVVAELRTALEEHIGNADGAAWFSIPLKEP